MPSRLIGYVMVDSAAVPSDHVEVYYKGHLVESMAIRGKGKARIDYRDGATVLQGAVVSQPAGYDAIESEPMWTLR